MKRTSTVAALSVGMTLIAALGASAQDVYTNAVKTNTTFGSSFTVAQNDPVTKKTSAGAINNTSATDTLQTLYKAGLATIAFDSTSAQKTLFTGTLGGLADSVGTASNGANGLTQFNFNGSGATSAADTSVVDFVFTDPAAPNGYTLTDLALFTLATGQGYTYYDLDIAYSTNGVTFTKFLTAQDALGNISINPAAGTTTPVAGPCISEQLFASNFNGAISGVKALQITFRPSPYNYLGTTINPDGTSRTYTNPNTNFLVGTYAAEFDLNMTPTPAAAPEPSQTAAFGLGFLGLAGLAFKARKRRIVS